MYIFKVFDTAVRMTLYR